MAVNFKIGEQIAIGHANNLGKGFGLPIVKRAFINAATIKQDKPDAVSLLGTPLYGTLFLESPAYFNYEYDDFLQEYKAVAVIHPENNKQIKLTKYHEQFS